MTVSAVIVAAGKGERFGDSGKVMAPLRGRPVLSYSLDAFEQAADVDEIIIVAGEHTRPAIEHLCSHGQWSKVSYVVVGGETRQQSTAYGVAAVSADASVILVHDAARPLIRPEQIDACIDAARAHGCAILAAPVTDTIKRVDEGAITATIDRATLWAAQTPQAFRADLMRQMVAYSLQPQAAVTDEASLAEALGYSVHIVPGDSTNLKITHLTDLAIAEAILTMRREPTS